MVRQEKWLRKGWKAARVAANAAVAQAKSSERAFLSTNRPRMRVKHIWLQRDLEAGKPIMIEVVTVNAGTTEATVIEFDVVTHVAPKAKHPPNEPFKGRIPHSRSYILPSGKTLDWAARPAGEITLSEIRDIRNGLAYLFCFAYVDYIDTAVPPTPRKTSCCRVFDPSLGAASSFGGTFKQAEESEYEYED